MATDGVALLLAQAHELLVVDGADVARLHLEQHVVGLELGKRTGANLALALLHEARELHRRRKRRHYKSPSLLKASLSPAAAAAGVVLAHYPVLKRTQAVA